MIRSAWPAGGASPGTSFMVSSVSSPPKISWYRVNASRQLPPKNRYGRKAMASSISAGHRGESDDSSVPNSSRGRQRSGSAGQDLGPWPRRSGHGIVIVVSEQTMPAPPKNIRPEPGPEHLVRDE